MATLVGTQTKFEDALQELIELDYNAIEAYRSSIDRVSDQRSKDVLAEYICDYQRNIQELTDVLYKHGYKAPTSPSAKRVFTKGKVVLSDLFGDEAVLSALSSNENETNKAYDNLWKRMDVWEDVKWTLERGRQDGLKHKNGLEDMKVLLKTRPSRV